MLCQAKGACLNPLRTLEQDSPTVPRKQKAGITGARWPLGICTVVKVGPQGSGPQGLARRWPWPRLG